VAEPVRDFKLTEDGEWDVQNGDFAVVAGQEAVPQGIRIRTRFWKGECFLDESIGVDYHDVVFAKPTDPLHVRAEFESAIRDTPDVKAVVGAQLIDDGDRNATLDFQYDDAYSEDTLSAQSKVT
jgi:hypothetical protein